MNYLKKVKKKEDKQFTTDLINHNQKQIEFFEGRKKRKHKSNTTTAQKTMLSIKGFFSKRDQICRNLWIWSHLLNKSSMKTFILCSVC